MVVEINRAALPSPDLSYSGVVPGVLPLPDTSDADVEGVWARWRAPYPLVDDVDAGTSSLVFIINGVSYGRDSYVSEGDGSYRAFSNGGLYPEVTYVVVTGAKTLDGHQSYWAWTFTTRYGERGESDPSEISVGYKATPGVVAEVSKYLADGFAAPGEITIIGGTRGDAVGALYTKLGGLLLVIAELRAALINGEVDVAGLVPAALPGGVTVLLRVNPFGLGVDFNEATLFAFTLNDRGAADATKARLTVKLDFMELLALRSTDAGQGAIEAALRATGLNGDLQPIGEALRALRVGSRAILPGVISSVEVVEERLTSALLVTGASQETINEALRTLETKGGSGVLIEVDLMDEILNEGR